MILTSSPQALPGSCYFCGSSNRESFVDTQISIDFHGALYICDICTRGMGAMVGMLSAEDAEKIYRKLAELETETYNLKKERDGLKAAVDGLTSARRYSNIDPPGPVAGLFEDSAGDSEGSQDEGTDLGAGEIQPPESSNDEGVDDVRPTRGKQEFSLFG